MNEEALCKELEEFCREQGLPYLSADEIMYEGVNRDQAVWLADFIDRWSQMMRGNS